MLKMLCKESVESYWEYFSLESMRKECKYFHLVDIKSFSSIKKNLYINNVIFSSKEVQIKSLDLY